MSNGVNDGDSPDEESEWADDDGATQMTGSPAFELLQGVPLPISVPPPAPSAAVKPVSAPGIPAVPAALRPAAGAPIASRAASPGRMPPRAPASGPTSPRVPASGPTLPRVAGPAPTPARSAAGPMASAPGAGGPRISKRRPSQPKLALPAAPAPRAAVAPARAAQPPPQQEQEEVEAATSVLDREAGGSLLAQMTAAESALASAPIDVDDIDIDNDEPTMAGPVEDLIPGRRANRGPPPLSPALDPTKRVQSANVSPPATFSKPAPAAPDEEPEESTMSVDRDELFRKQDAQVVVGDDAIGDEATLALGPGQLAGQIERALGASPAADLPVSALASTAFAPALAAGAPAFPPPSSPIGTPATSALGPGHAHAPPPPGPAAGPPPWQNEPPPQPAGYAHPQPNPLQPTAALPALRQPPAYPRQGMVPTESANMAPWPAPPNTRKQTKARTQTIILLVVGVVCLAIFGTGLYMFFTTMNRG